MDAAATRLADTLQRAEHVVVLTGAGVSTAAGIPDFRGPHGLYATGKYPADRVFDSGYFPHHPELFYGFSRELLPLLDAAEPTFTHRWLAELEQQGRLRGVITQNIDMLHTRAGSRAVLELHGSYRTARCLTCARDCDLQELRLRMARQSVPRCDCGGLLKPDIVFFGDAVRHLDEAARWVTEAGLLLVIGSSLTVWPAAGLPALCRGAVVVINRGDVLLPSGAVQINAESDAFLRLAAGALK